jgi:phage/plasmid-like protein (TIGR03299 family)
MAHDLDFTTGRAAIAYRGETPWHGYGTVILPGDSPADIRRKAGLEYDVVAAPISYTIDQQFLGSIPMVPSHKLGTVNVPSRKALVRNDTWDMLSVVSDEYRIVQPGTLFDFFTKLLAKDGIAIETAGALRNGARIWCCGRIDADFVFFGDVIRPYVFAATSYDGAMSTQAVLSNIRPVCNNTITAAGAYRTESDANSYKVPHNREFSITEAHGKLGLDMDAWTTHCNQVAELARYSVSPQQALEYFYTVAGQGDQIMRSEGGAIVSFPEPTRVVKQFINAFHNGPGADLLSANGTAWGLVNAVTFYQDHLAPATNNGARFDSASFGGGNVRKQHALELAVDMLAVA